MQVEHPLLNRCSSLEELNQCSYSPELFTVHQRFKNICLHKCRCKLHSTCVLLFIALNTMPVKILGILDMVYAID